MPVGKTKVKFIGGCLDGQIYDSFDTRGLTQKIIQFDGYWFGVSKDDKYQLLKSERVGKNWLNYSVDVYEKEPKGNDGYFIYRFKEKDMIDRCTALTKKGTLCNHVAIANTDFCPIHTRSSTVEEAQSSLQ